MRTLITVVVLLAICVAGVGLYRGWFTVSQPDSTPGSNEVNLQLKTDVDKIKADADAVTNEAVRRTGELTGDTDDSEDLPAEEADLSPETSDRDR